MRFTQLDPQLPVTVGGKGAGYAFAVIDYGQEHKPQGQVLHQLDHGQIANQSPENGCGIELSDILPHRQFALLFAL